MLKSIVGHKITHNTKGAKFLQVLQLLFSPLIQTDIPRTLGSYQVVTCGFTTGVNLPERETDHTHELGCPRAFS
jgi:hypothetical protein